MRSDNELRKEKTTHNIECTLEKIDGNQHQSDDDLDVNLANGLSDRCKVFKRQEDDCDVCCQIYIKTLELSLVALAIIVAIQGQTRPA